MKQKTNLISALNGIVVTPICMLTIAVMLSSCAEDSSPANAQRNAAVPMPDYVQGVDAPIVNLNGTWLFSKTADRAEAAADRDSDEWREILVPGEAFMQGHAIEQDQEFYYLRDVEIPPDFEGQDVFLRFDGVYSHAKVFIGGNFVGEHTGGFTAWDLNITDYIVAGNSVAVTVAVIDAADDISRASFYAKHNIGGILRDVWLFAVPRIHLTHLYLQTDLDDLYKDATLRVDAAIVRPAAKEVSLTLELVDAFGATVVRRERELFPSDSDRIQIAITVNAPQLWDAEHPNLYRLRAELSAEGELLQVLDKTVGFRDVRIVDEQLLVNGNPVKLRGVNRHSIHPTLGRTDSPELDAKDIELFREANVNFIRTSHYPPTARFLELADEYGMYVEVEAPITWWNAMEDSSAYTERFVGQTAEMVDGGRNHASVIIWSIGNESFWDENFRLSFEYVKAIDATRPVIWSYAPPAGPSPGQYEIFSEHYPEWNASLEHRQMPTLLDEYAHVSSYMYPVMQRDPGIRDFWGDGFSRFWDNMFREQHILGGAIWGGIDEVFFAPDQTFGYGQWGIVDTWRRKKPEFWLTRKAYSPVRVEQTDFDLPAAGAPLQVPVKNRFDHTNLQELSVTWSVGGDVGSAISPDVAPHTDGLLEIPGRAWANGDRVRLTVTRSDGFEVDEFELGIGKTTQNLSPRSAAAPSLVETDGAFEAYGEGFSLIFDKQKGKIVSARMHGEELVLGGPDIVVTPLDLQPWVLSNIHATREGEQIRVQIVGSYGDVGVQFDIRVSGDGAVKIDYTVDNLPDGIEEIGVRLALTDQIDTFDWHRKAPWSVYPEDHIGRPVGTALRNRLRGEHEYRQQPQWSWSMDTKDYFLFGTDDPGRASNDFRSTKANIYSATATSGESGIGIRVESDGSHAVRMGTTIVDCRVDDEHPDIVYLGKWEPYEDGANCRSTEHFSNEKGATARLSFFGDAVKWLGPTHYNLGKANVFIDDELVASELDLYSVGKINQRVLFEGRDLEEGWHTIEVAVSGSKNDRATDSYVVVDGFHHSSLAERGRETDMNVLSDWSYEPDWGNVAKSVDIGETYTGTVKLRFIEARKDLQ